MSDRFGIAPNQMTPGSSPRTKFVDDTRSDLGFSRSDPSNGMTNYLSRYEEQQLLARRASAEAAERKSRQRSGRKSGTDDSFAEAMQLHREAIRERLEHGFHHEFVRDVGGRFRKPFVEHGLRSETLNSIAAKKFAASVPRGGKLRTSMDKATLEVQTASKLLALDYAYIECNKTFWSVFRLDCDRIFQSREHCLQELRELVGIKIPCLPHLIVGDLLPDGRYARPHFYFLLPDGDAVWNDPGDPRCRVGPRRLFQRVGLGLTEALLELGVDPNAPLLTMRGKNPLSPYWHTLCPNDEHWPTLSEYASWFDKPKSREKLVRIAAELQSGITLRKSNDLFNTVRDAAFETVRTWHFAGDDRLTGNAGSIADELHQELQRLMTEVDHGLTDIQLDLLIAKIADYAAGSWDPWKLETSSKCRGRLLSEVEGIASVRERQAIGGAYSGNLKRKAAQETVQKLTEAYRDLVREGADPSQTAVAAQAGVSRRTAIRHWKVVLEAVSDASEQGCDTRCIGKKLATNPAHPKPETPEVIGPREDQPGNGAPSRNVGNRRGRGTFRVPPFMQFNRPSVREEESGTAPCLEHGPGMGAFADLSASDDKSDLGSTHDDDWHEIALYEQWIATEESPHRDGSESPS